MKKKENFLPVHLLKNFSIVGFWTLASRVLGFIRDILIASFLGSGPIAEAFLIAFSIPNIFRRLFAEGAFNTAFLPMLSKKLIKKANAETFSSEVLSVLIASLLLLCALAEIFMPILIFGMASGFSGDARFSISVEFGRVMFPYIFFISMSAFFGGILNALNKFSATAAAPLVLNLAIILSLLIAHYFETDYGWAMVLSVPLAGFIQMILVIFFLRQHNFCLTFKKPKITGKVKKLVVIAVPAALAGGVIQVNLLVGRQVASYFDGAIAWLNYADRLYQLPLGVVGITVGVVLLPNISKITAPKLEQARNNLINRSAEIVLIFTLPATSALLIIPYPLVNVLFARGAFSTLDAINTSHALLIYSLGLPAFVFQKIFSTIYFAHENTQSPLNYALIGMICNIVIALGLIHNFGYLAPPIGTSISGWIITLLLWRNLKTYNFKFDVQFNGTIIKIAFATAIFSLFLLISKLYLNNFLIDPNKKVISLTFLILTSTLLYILICRVLGLMDHFLARSHK